MKNSSTEFWNCTIRSILLLTKRGSLAPNINTVTLAKLAARINKDESDTFSILKDGKLYSLPQNDSDLQYTFQTGR